MFAEFLFGKKQVKKEHTFTGFLKRKKVVIRAKSPASAARKLYKSTPGFKNKGVKIITIKNKRGRVFKYRVKLQKVNAEVNYEGSKSIKFSYRINVKAVKQKCSCDSKYCKSCSPKK